MSLPQKYRGYLTTELLDVFERIPGGGAAHEPKGKFMAMRRLMQEYDLAPVGWKGQEEAARAKGLIAELKNPSAESAQKRVATVFGDTRGELSYRPAHGQQRVNAADALETPDTHE